MSSKLKYTTLDVFTHTRFSGNPLAIVHIPPSTTLTYDQKLTIAREFNLSETVFLLIPSSPSTEIEINIFTTTTELPFAGHPTIGTGFYILSGISGIFPTPPSTITLKTLSGNIPVSFDPVNRLARLSVAHDVKIHPKLDCTSFKAQQLGLAAGDYVNGLGGEHVCSIVKGMNFLLLELVSVEALSRLKEFPEGVVVPDGFLGEYEGFLGVYAYVRTGGGEDGVMVKLRTRMFMEFLEDSATGSAACALGSYLALTTGMGRVRGFEIVQGVEMGRRSEIGVKVVLTEGGAVEEVELEGGAVRVMEGFLTY